jgi:hypothetical protein
VSELEDRRQRAREAFYDMQEVSDSDAALEQAIETATRVKVDNALVQAYRPGIEPGSVMWHRVRNRLYRVFEAAGFEVEK